MKNTQLPTSILQTDFYELTMSYAYLRAGKARQMAGFELFVRNIKNNITENKFYTFNVEKKVVKFIESVLKEIKSDDFFDRFWCMIKDKVDTSTYKEVKESFENIPKTFDYTVLKNNSKILANIPVFQYYGPLIFGQILETGITNIINGSVGLFSNENMSETEFQKNGIVTEDYKLKLRRKAKEYRMSTSKIIFEAGFRRAPSFSVAFNASLIALEEGFSGTSNTSVFNYVNSKYINGTMAHAYILSFEKNGKPNELEAFKVWNKIFPKSTILIDTYNTVKAVNTLIENDIRPNAVRIDSDPIESLTKEVRAILDNNGWSEVKIFLSGDITPEKLKKWNNEKIPFDMCMVGTKFVNIDNVANINSGFVYKLVEINNNGQIEYPMKKSKNKSNYKGLKEVCYNEEENCVYTYIGTDNIGFNGDFSKINNGTNIKRIEK